MHELKFGLTVPSQCSYLPQQQEQLVFLLPQQPVDAVLYQQLLQLNFRRSGDQVYTPYCTACRACQSVRLNPAAVKYSRSQRRILNRARNNEWSCQLTDTPSVDYFPLFSDYINHKHNDGSMYPPSRDQLDVMMHCSWLKVCFLEQYYQQQLVAVTVVDETNNAYSAVYTFFHHSAAEFSPGILAILYLLQCTARDSKQWLYLGYQIDSCQKMAYKAGFLPQQRFINGEWCSFG